MSGPIKSQTPSGNQMEVVAGVYNSKAPTPQDGQGVGLQTDESGNLLVNIVAGGASGSNAAAGPTGAAVPADADYQGVNIGGTLTGVTGIAVGSAKAPTVAIVDGSGNQVTTFGGSNASVGTNGAAAPTSSTQAGGSDGTNLQPLQVDGSKNLKTVINAALPAGTNVIGHVIADSGSTTAVTQGTASNLKALVNLQDGSGNPITSSSGALSVSLSAASMGSRQAVSFTSSTGADTANTIALTNFANAMVTLHYSGTVTGGQMFFEVSDDNSNWYGITMAATDSATPPADNYTLSSAAGNITWQMFVGGYSFFRVRMHIQVVGSGTAIVAITPSTLPAEPAIEITGALPAGSNVIGHVVVDSGTLTTVSTVSAVTAISNALPAGTNTIGTVKVTGNAGGAFDAATGAAVPANALYEGLIATTSYPTAASSGNIVGMMGDKAGRPAVVLNTVRDLVGTAVVSNNSTASGVSFIGAGAAGVFNDIITFIATNRSSSATVVTLTDGTASYTFALAGNGGIVINFPTPLPATSSATAWTIGNSATVACDYIAVYAKNK